MASISHDKKTGRRVIQFTGSDKKRRTLRLGKVNKKSAEFTRTKVEHLVSASITGDPIEDETARWIAGLDDAMIEKLAKVGLAKDRKRATLKAFTDQYIESRHDSKPGTIEHLRRAQTDLVGFFGESKPLRDITEGDAEDFRLHLLARPLAEPTVRRRCGRGKQFLNAAMRHKLIPSNPFIDLKTADLANRDRDHFISVEDAGKVLQACPDAEWRLIFALSRFGGLRCPSEHLAMRWEDVDWERERLRIRSPKTEHHVGHESRLIPMFPELRPYLVEAFEQASEGEQYVIARYRKANANLRTQLHRIIERAGLKPWSKPFANLRSTRQTELEETHPPHVVNAWIGNSRRVAEKHYLQVTDEHFERATRAAKSDVTFCQTDELALQNPTQHPAATSRTNPQDTKKARVNQALVRDDASACDTLQNPKAPPRGLEPRTRRLTAACSTN
jgi:integrase